MPNPWRLLLWPCQDGELSDVMRRVTVKHSQRWHAHHHTSGSGHLYQGRFKSFPIESDEHLYTVLRYVERNPVRANLTERSEAWRWSSAWRYYRGDERQRSLLADWPIDRPGDWRRRVNRAETQAELTALRRCVRRSQPFGGADWTKRIIERLGLHWTIRPRGRPRNEKPSS